MNSVQGIATQLRALGIPVLKTSPIKQLEDGEIQISNTVYLQVGDTYLSVMECKGMNLHFYEAANLVDAAKEIKRVAKLRMVKSANVG